MNGRRFNSEIFCFFAPLSATSRSSCSSRNARRPLANLSHAELPRMDVYDFCNDRHATLSSAVIPDRNRISSMVVGTDNQPMAISRASRQASTLSMLVMAVVTIGWRFRCGSGGITGAETAPVS